MSVISDILRIETRWNVSSIVTTGHTGRHERSKHPKKGKDYTKSRHGVVISK